MNAWGSYVLSHRNSSLHYATFTAPVTTKGHIGWILILLTWSKIRLCNPIRIQSNFQKRTDFNFHLMNFCSTWRIAQHNTMYLLEVTRAIAVGGGPSPGYSWGDYGNSCGCSARPRWHETIRGEYTSIHARQSRNLGQNRVYIAKRIGANILHINCHDTFYISNRM